MERLIKGTQLMSEVFSIEFTELVQKQIGETYPPFLDFLKSTFGDLYGDNTLILKQKRL